MGKRCFFMKIVSVFLYLTSHSAIFAASQSAQSAAGNAQASASPSQEIPQEPVVSTDTTQDQLTQMYEAQQAAAQHARDILSQKDAADMPPPLPPPPPSSASSGNGAG